MIINNILVPLDFSETSAYVLDFARVLADACGASLHLLHVINCALPCPRSVDQQREDACRRLDELSDRLDRHAHPTTTWCEIGTPAEAIVRFADEHGVDAIVMGTHRHGPTFRMAAGSIAEGVLGSAPCAVVAVKCPAGRAAPWATGPAATTTLA